VEVSTSITLQKRFGETQAGGDNWMSILTSPRLALRIGLPRCSTGSRRKRCARSPQFSPHSPNAALLTHYMKAEELFWSGRRDLNSGPPAPKAGSSPLGSPSFPISNLITQGLDPEMVVDGCGWKCLRMHGVPTLFPTAKTERISDHYYKVRHTVD